MTLNQTIKVIEDLGNAHQQIKTTFYGTAFDFLSKGSDNVYRALFFVLTGASINGKPSTLTSNFIYLMIVYYLKNQKSKKYCIISC